MYYQNNKALRTAQVRSVMLAMPPCLILRRVGRSQCKLMFFPQTHSTSPVTRKKRWSGGRVPVQGMALQGLVKYPWNVPWCYVPKPAKGELLRPGDVLLHDSPFTPRVYQHVRSVSKNILVAFHSSNLEIPTCAPQRVPFLPV